MSHFRRLLRTNGPYGGTEDKLRHLQDPLAATRFRCYDSPTAMTAPALMAVCQPSLCVDVQTRQVYVNGESVDPSLSVKQFDLLWFLYQNQGRAVSKDEIAYAIWPELEGEVYNMNIDRMISRLRSRIEPSAAEETRFISTIRGYGYCLTVP